MTASSIDDLRRRAEAGGARAHYELAAALAHAGERAEADIWLRRAAKGGAPEAYFTLATRQLQTKAGLAEARELLEKSVNGGSIAAMRALAALRAEGFDAPPDWMAASELVLAAARAGDPAARRDLAGLCFLRDEDDEDGAALLEEAARREPIAGAVFVRRAIEGRADRALASAILQKLAAIGYPRAAALATALEAMGATPPSATPQGAAEPNWKRVGEKLKRMGLASSRGLDPASEARRPSRTISRETLCDAPRAHVVRQLAPPEILEYVMATAAKRLAPSMTFDPLTGIPRKDEYRTSMTATLGPADLDLTLVALNRLIAAIAGVDPSRAEFMSILRYLPGEEYKPHFDWIPPTGRDFDASGQRIMTALLYLNDDYDGGETHLIAPDVTFKGRPGDALVFSNVNKDGAPDKSSRHASLPVRAGVKWLASKWFREREFVF